MSINRIDQYPGRGSGSACRDQENPDVMAAEASQMITPTARTHDAAPNDSAMRPAMAMASLTYPTRSAQTAILQCPLHCSSGGTSMPGIVPQFISRSNLVGRPPRNLEPQIWRVDALAALKRQVV